MVVVFVWAESAFSVVMKLLFARGKKELYIERLNIQMENDQPLIKIEL